MGEGQRETESQTARWDEAVGALHESTDSGRSVSSTDRAGHLSPGPCLVAGRALLHLPRPAPFSPTRSRVQGEGALHFQVRARAGMYGAGAGHCLPSCLPPGQPPLELSPRSLHRQPHQEETKARTREKGGGRAGGPTETGHALLSKSGNPKKTQKEERQTERRT